MIKSSQNHSVYFNNFFLSKPFENVVDPLLAFLYIIFKPHFEAMFFISKTKIGLKFHLHSPYFQSHQFCIEKIAFFFSLLKYQKPICLFFSPRGAINRSCTTVWYGWIYILLCLMYILYIIWGFVLF